MRDATAGPNPKSPPGVLASLTAKRSKNLANEGPGIVLPWLSMVILEKSVSPFTDMCTSSPSAENLTAVSKSVCNALMSKASSPRTKSWVGEEGGTRHPVLKEFCGETIHRLLEVRRSSEKRVRRPK